MADQIDHARMRDTFLLLERLKALGVYRHEYSLALPFTRPRPTPERPHGE